MIGNIILLLPAIALFGALLWYLRRVRGLAILHPAVWLTMLYTGSFVSAIFVNKETISSFSETTLADMPLVFVLALSLVVFLWPLVYYAPARGARRSYEWLDLFVKLSSPLVIFSLVYILPYSLVGIQSGAEEVRFNLNVYGISILPRTPLTTLAVTTAQFYAVYAFALIYYVTGGKKNVFGKIISFIGSLLYVVVSYAFAARDGLIWFAFSYLFAIWYFRPYLQERQLRKLRRGLGVVGGGAAVLFLAFTIQRFADSKVGVIDSMVTYYGQQPYVFVETVKQQVVFYEGRLRFPLLTSLLGTSGEVIRTNPYEWSFGTFVKDLYATGGWWVMTLATLLVPLAIGLGIRSSMVVRRQSYALLAIVYVQFLYQGVFYFRMGNMAGNAYMVAMVAFAVASMVSLKVK